MAKQQTYQKYIYKIHSSKLIKSNLNLNESLSDMRNSDEIISLADSQTLRFIDEINGLSKDDFNSSVKAVRDKIKEIRKLPKSVENKNQIKKLFGKLDELQNKPEYVAIILDDESHFEKINKGFSINNLKYKRFVGTPNGVKKSVVIYCSISNKGGKEIHNELWRRCENGRNPEIKLCPAKYEAYKALTCSASIPVSNPNGVLVVDDLVLHFKAPIIELNDENTNEPVMENKVSDVELDNSDGYGIMLPSLAQKWSNDLKLDYLMGGCCIRNSFLKGMMFTFDFREFAQKYAKSNIVKDAWGNEHSINDIEMILTTSMLKLWEAYDSIDDYLDNCRNNHYTFAITKVCPKRLENVRALNYQFIQSYELTDEQIEELISPTVCTIKDVFGNDINKTILFLRGTNVTEENVMTGNDDFVKALMIDKEMLNDPYVIDKINALIKKRIENAKIGVIDVYGNYAIISGDPFALCQHIFKTNVDDDGNDIECEMGLLKAGEIYSHYWITKGVDKVVCFRAPMTNHNNLRIMKIPNDEDRNYWFRYMNTVNIINCHDTFAHALCGADTDGDQIMTTDNAILLSNTKETPAIMCVQRKAEKTIITEELLRKANRDSFGDEIGTTTNHVTAMFDLLPLFPKDSDEYQTLQYRIMCGQLFQQNAIDRTKGIIANPMPKCWYVREKVKEEYSDNKIKSIIFNNSICVTKKPYFMIYIYPKERAEYNKYIKNTNKKCLKEFRLTVDELIRKEKKSENELNFLKWYEIFYPVSDNGCVMNRLCHIVEEHFDGFNSCLKQKNGKFDCSRMMSDAEYSSADYTKIRKIYANYVGEVSRFMYECNNNHFDKSDMTAKYDIIKDKYKKLCYSTVTNQYELCNIVLKLCYDNSKSKQFAWDMCGETIIENLLKHNQNKIHLLVADDNGHIEYLGEKFKEVIKEVC